MERPSGPSAIPTIGQLENFRPSDASSKMNQSSRDVTHFVSSRHQLLQDVHALDQEIGKMHTMTT